ncbi:MAG: hypothetical protein IPH78_05465 [Bacteroidetes bacterium]|nr:hypothetical protein [Bacteroidota bacterium]
MRSYNIFDLSRRRIFLLIGTCLVFALTIFLLNEVLDIRNFWDGFYTEADIRTFFCERTLWDRLVRQPINTFSNFIYWMVAVALLRRGWKDQRIQKRYNLVSANPFYSITFGLIMFYIFCASTFFHSSLIHVASQLDFSAVYSLSLFPLMYYTHRVWLLLAGVDSHQRHPLSTRTVMFVFSMLYILLTFFLPEGAENYTVLGIIFVLILFGVVVEKKDPGRTNRRYLVVSSLSILIAVMWFAMDVYKVLCNPDSVLQPHSLWHFFAGVSSFYFYMYIRSERGVVSQA